MYLRDFAFRPALIPTLATLLVLPLLLGLGFWQLDRAHQKEELFTLFETKAVLPYAPLSEVDLSSPASLFRKVIAQGRYDDQHQVLLDNQIHGGQPGYHVYTPLRLQGEESAILVNRGWVPMGASRQQLPGIAVTTTSLNLKGWVARPANPPLRLQAPLSSGAWPQVVQYVDYSQLTAALGYPLEPAVILLAPDEEQGFLRDWQPHFPGFGPERHRGYAVQWFALAIALLVIYLVVNTHRRRPEDA